MNETTRNKPVKWVGLDGKYRRMVRLIVVVTVDVGTIDHSGEQLCKLFD